MIVEYTNNLYNEEIKDLFVELQEYIASIDKEGYNILTPEYRQKYFDKTMQEIKAFNGKMLLFKQDGKIVGVIVGLICEAVSTYDFKAPKRGKITELIVSKNCRSKGYGKALLTSMEKYLKKQGCQSITIEVFGYNSSAINFYERNGYHTRVIDVTKTL